MNAPHPHEVLTARHITAGRFAGNLVACLLGLAGAAAALHTYGGSLSSDVELDRKRVGAESDVCEVLVVGPSYVAAQFEPNVFDKEAKRLGHAGLRSCKFGRTGMRGFELRMQLDRLLREHEWPKLRLVVLDVTLGQMARMDAANWYNVRSILWHTWRVVPWLVEYYRERPEDLTVAQFNARVGHLLMNSLNVGAGPEVLSNVHGVRHLAHALDPSVELPRTQMERYLKERARRLKRRRKYTDDYMNKTSAHKHQHKLAELARQKAEDHDEHIEDWPLLPLRELARAHGAEAVFIRAPVWRGMPSKVEQRDPNDPLVLFDFNNAHTYPELYEPSSRGRNHHLSLAGSRVYTRLIARAVLPQLTMR